MTLAHLFEGTFQDSISRTSDEAEKWLLDKVTAGVGHIAKKTQTNFSGLRKAGFPAGQHGIQGFSQLGTQK
jgi:hypothetical protein